MNEKDKQLIIELQKNGRMTLTELGKKFNISHVAVKKRLENLINKGVLRIYPQLNFSKLKLRIAAVLVEVETFKRLKELLNIFNKCPRTFFVANVTGRHNLLVLMFAEDIDTLRSIVDICSIRTQKGIRKSEVCVGDVIYPDFVPIVLPFTRESDVAPCGANCSKCDRYHTKKCLGCPATKNYRGTL